MSRRNLDSNEVSVVSSYAESLSESRSAFPQVQHDADNDEAYSEDDFDEYSDEFEADSESDTDDVPRGSRSEPCTSDSMALRVGDQVQVHWEQEGEWFDGDIACLEAGRVFVRYTDGDRQWEPIERVRPVPPYKTQLTEQLQLVDCASVALRDRRVIVYWHNEGTWFEGSITNVCAADGGVQRILILYDDGEEQWVARPAFRDVLLLSSPSTARPPVDRENLIETGAERVIIPRQYTPVVSTHFKPVRVARSYRCAVRNHIGSILTPRLPVLLQQSFYAYEDAKLQVETVQHAMPHHEYSPPTRECAIQTEIPVNRTSSA